jgi:putative ABC transport system permease protein
MIVDVGPLLRTLRRQPGIWALMVLEIAVGVTTIASLILSGSWYGENGSQPSGLDEPNLVLINMYTPSESEDPEIAERAIYAREQAVTQRVRGSPGVEAATRVTSSILEDRWSYPSLFSARRDEARGDGAPARDSIGWPNYVDGDLARTLRLQFLAGGSPSWVGVSDGDDRPAGAVLTRCLAERLFGDPAAAVGARLSSESVTGVPITGVVENVNMRVALIPYYQCTAFLFGGAPHDHQARLLVRVRPGARAAVVATLTAAFAGESPRRFVEVKPFDFAASANHHVGRGLVIMLGMFGAMVALIALLGALAATSFLVAQRTRQIGIRRALGATRTDIVAFFLVESALAASIGSVIGIAATLWLFTLMRSVFHSIHFKPALVGLALLVLWSGTLLATLIPALRAARVPPSVAGRSL